MLVKGDKLIVTKDVASFLREGEVVEVIDVNDDMISFVFGDGMHKGLMNYAECEAHFEKYEEQKIETPTITEERIEWLLENSEFEVETIYDKCTVLTCKLPNGFVIVESSACVSPENYDEEMGIEICLDRIKSRVWELEGYKLQSELYEEDVECPYGCDDCSDCPCNGECVYEEDECLDADLDCDCAFREECWGE